MCSSEHCLHLQGKYNEIYLNLSWHVIAISIHFIFVFTNSFNLRFHLYLRSDNTKGRHFLKIYLAAHSTFSPPDTSTPICNSIITSPVVSTLTRVNNRAIPFKEWVTRHSVWTVNYTLATARAPAWRQWEIKLRFLIRNCVTSTDKCTLFKLMFNSVLGVFETCRRHQE
jgi:hypothetical protein